MRWIFTALVIVGIARSGGAATPETSVGRHWEPKPGAPGCVENFVNGLPALKTQAIKDIELEIAKVKQNRTAIARAPMRTQDVTGTRTSVGGTIVRTDGSQDVERRHQIKLCDDQVLALYAKEKQVKADDLWLPGQMSLDWEVDSFGTLPAARVFQVIDGRNVIADVGPHSFWLTGVDTANLVDGSVVEFGQEVRLKGTKQYNTIAGATRTVFLAELFDVKSQLVIVDDGAPSPRSNTSMPYVPAPSDTRLSPTPGSAGFPLTVESLKGQLITQHRFAYWIAHSNERPMTIEADGTVRTPDGNWERTWTVQMIDGFPRLVISGPNGSATLTEGIDGVFRGSWNNPAGSAATLRLPK